MKLYFVTALILIGLGTGGCTGTLHGCGSLLKGAGDLVSGVGDDAQSTARFAQRKLDEKYNPGAVPPPPTYPVWVMKAEQEQAHQEQLLQFRARQKLEAHANGER